MPGHVHLVANPRAGRGRAGKELGRLTSILESAAVEHRVVTTEHHGHATSLAILGAREGAGTVVAVGGDGTVNEVVNGLMTIEEVDRPALGVVVAGSGADFARTFGLPQHIDTSLAGVVGDTRPIDVGRIEAQGPDGPVVRHYVNISNVGLAAAVVKAADRLPRWLGKLRYIVAFWPVLARYTPEQMTLMIDGESHTIVAHNLLVANARYAGGGMHFSPHSEPDDGVFDVQMNIGPKRQAFTLMPRIYRGTHLPNERIFEAAGREIMLVSPTPQVVEADGELIGTSPLTITVVPRAIRLVV